MFNAEDARSRALVMSTGGMKDGLHDVETGSDTRLRMGAKNQKFEVDGVHVKNAN